VKPRVVGYGSCGRAPPCSTSACFEAFDHGAESYCIDVCETRDGVLIAANRRTLRFLAGWTSVIPSWGAVEGADLGQAFGGGVTRHRVLTFAGFLGSVGPLSMHVHVDGPMSEPSIREFERVIRARESGSTTVLGRPQWLSHAELPKCVRQVAVLQVGQDCEDLPSVHVDAIAMPARALATFGRTRRPKVALACDTRAGVVAAKDAGVVDVHSERPAWLRAAWMDDALARVYER
jgi:hypothetical protein